MIKNFNDTTTLIMMIIILAITIKVGFGLMFSSHHNDTIKGNFKYFIDYTENEEE